jgi:glycerophosphoryl diester phosphodiesterase
VPAYADRDSNGRARASDKTAVGNRTVYSKLSTVDIIAHRGASHDAPENTLAAARMAWEQGADALECDVHLTKDGRLVVIHDDDTARVGAVSMAIRESTFDSLRALDVGSWKNPRFGGERIPTLDELIALVPAGRRIFIEMKCGPEGVLPLKESLARTGTRPEGAAIISFDLATVTAAKKTLPQHAAFWIVDSPGEAPSSSLTELIRRAGEAGLDGLDLECSWEIDAAMMQQIHAERFQVYAWTVDDPAVARRWQRAGADGIATNRPGWMRQKIAK